MAGWAWVWMVPLLTACSLEEIATARHSGATALRLDHESVRAECRLEAGKLGETRPRLMTAAWHDRYLAACHREITVMRALGRR